MASVASLPGSSALKSRIGLISIKDRRSESVRGLSLTSSAPGKAAGTGVQHGFDGLGDQRERPRRSVKGDLSAPHPGKPGFQRPCQAPEAGITRHDFQQWRPRTGIDRSIGRPRAWAGTTGRSFQKTPRRRAAGIARSKFFGIALTISAPAPRSRHWRIPASALPRQPGSAAPDRRACSNANIALAPVKIRLRSAC